VAGGEKSTYSSAQINPTSVFHWGAFSTFSSITNIPEPIQPSCAQPLAEREFAGRLIPPLDLPGLTRRP